MRIQVVWFDAWTEGRPHLAQILLNLLTHSHLAMNKVRQFAVSVEDIFPLPLLLKMSVAVEMPWFNEPTSVCGLRCADEQTHFSVLRCSLHSNAS